jgi:hypothetical protein
MGYHQVGYVVYIHTHAVINTLQEAKGSFTIPVNILTHKCTQKHIHICAYISINVFSVRETYAQKRSCPLLQGLPPLSLNRLCYVCIYNMINFKHFQANWMTLYMPLYNIITVYKMITWWQWHDEPVLVAYVLSINSILTLFIHSLNIIVACLQPQSTATSQAFISDYWN